MADSVAAPRAPSPPRYSWQTKWGAILLTLALSGAIAMSAFGATISWPIWFLLLGSALGLVGNFFGAGKPRAQRYLEFTQFAIWVIAFVGILTAKP